MIFMGYLPESHRIGGLSVRCSTRLRVGGAKDKLPGQAAVLGASLQPDSESANVLRIVELLVRF